MSAVGSDFEIIIGLEVHVQLKTKTKMFSGSTHAFGREPNSQVDPTCMGLPGSLPVINDHAVDLAIQSALAIDAEIHRFSKFDRKHYFYPDSPRNYQISQYDEPYCTDGHIVIDLEDGGTKTIGITRIHMEDDAGKLIHQDAGTFSEVDLNRAGTPLCEIVSEPDMRSPAEAYAFLVELKRNLKYCEVSDCEMQEGSLRCDANVSIRPVGQEEFGTKVEVKNLNSFRAVEAAILYEAEQHALLHRAGRYHEVVQETKLWDPNKKVTQSMRGKEGAADYRYFPEPDLPPLIIEEARIEKNRAEMPEMPRKRQERFEQEFGFSKAVAGELTNEKEVADYFEALLEIGIGPKPAANWTREEAIRLATIKHLSLREAAPLEKLAAVIHLVEEGKVARVVAKGECDALFASDESPEDYFTSRDMIQEQDEGALAGWVAQAIANNPKPVEDVQNGKMSAVGRLIGETMKASGGKADPKAVRGEILKQLGVA